MASSAEERFHEEWLGLVQPVDGLVVSIPVLVDAQCESRQRPEVQRRLAEMCAPAGDGGELAFNDLGALLEGLLGWPADRIVAGDALPEALTLYVPEGGQIIRPTLALGSPPVILVWDLGPDCVGLPLDKAEIRTGTWEYPVSAKLDRLLRHTRVPIGVLTNRTQVRLLYAPHGESSGSITFRVADMSRWSARPTSPIRRTTATSRSPRSSTMSALPPLSPSSGMASCSRDC